MANSIKVTFTWLEHAPGAPESQWQRHQVERMVPLRKGSLAQGRVVEKYYLRLLMKRVTTTLEVDGQFAYWTSFSSTGISLNARYGGKTNLVP